MIKIEDLSKSYLEANGQKKLIFDHLNFEIYKSEKIMILGSSGSGKSTLLNLLSGIDNTDFGRISIDGFVITQVSEKERTAFRRQNLGFIFQNYNLINTLNVIENIELVNELNGIKSSDFAYHLLEEVNLADKAKSMPDQLSGGEQQRVAIVRALVHKPKLLLADEATGNLDSMTAKTVMELLQKLHREYKPCMVFVTHDQSILTYSDRAFELKLGQLNKIERENIK